MAFILYLVTIWKRIVYSDKICFCKQKFVLYAQTIWKQIDCGNETRNYKSFYKKTP